MLKTLVAALVSLGLLVAVPTASEARHGGAVTCEMVKRGYATMSWAQKMKIYWTLTPAQIAFGRKCLGL